MCEGLRNVVGRACGLLALTACGGDPGPRGNAGVTVRDSAGVVITTTGADPRQLPTWALDSAGRSLEGDFTRVSDGAWVGDDHVVILDRGTRRLSIFDSAGNVVGVHGRDGAGPGEFRAPNTLSVLGDSIYVYDRITARLSVFHWRDGYARGLAFAAQGADTLPYRVWALDPGRLSLHHYLVEPAETSTLPRLVRYRGTLIPADATGAPSAQGLTFAAGIATDLAAGEGAAYFRGQAFFATGEGEAVFGLGDNYEVTVLDASARPVRRFEWTGRTLPLNASSVDSARGDLRTFWARMDTAIATQLERDLFLERLLPRNRAALERAVVASPRAYWVQRYATPMATPVTPTAWDVLDGSMVPIATIRIPPGLRVLAVRGERVLLAENDGPDGTNVHLRRFRR
jgi:6-bladed beta-propeller